MEKNVTVKELAAMLNQAVTFQRDGDKEAARKKYEEVLFHEKTFKNSSPSQAGSSQETLVKTIFSQTYNNLGVFLEEDNLWGQALGNFRAALDFSPGNVEALTNMARVSSKRMNFDSALIASKSALQLKPDYIPAVIQLCRVCYNLGSVSDALEALKKVENELETNVRLNTEYGRILEKAGRLIEAREKLEKAVKLGPNNIYALLNLANVNFQLNQFFDAVENYQKILGLNPKHVLALTGMGFLLQTVGQFPDALKCYQSSLAENPGHHETLGFYASLLELTGQSKEALELAEKLLKMPKIPERAIVTGSLTKANAERKLGLLDESIATLKGLKNHAKTTAARTQVSFGLGFSYDRLKKTGEAFQEFEKANQEFLKTHQSFLENAGEFPGLLDDLLAVDFSKMFEPPANKKTKTDPEAPIFVVGPVLAGSMAVSQLIQFIPKVSVFEDTHEIQGIRRQLMKSNLGYPGCLEGLGAEELNHLKTLFDEVHEKSISKGEGGRAIHVDALHIIDLPVIMKLFPNAKFVFVDCDPRDSVLNTFMKDFNPTRVTINYSDLETITGLYTKTIDLWHKYQKEVPLEVLSVKYEDFIKDPAKGLQKILKFIDYKDLKGAQKAFEGDEFFNKTAELSSKYPPGRWTGYRGYLGETLKTLAPYCKAQGYED
ncbi:MAG: sulfotransferase [Sphingomonadales bacterium]